MLKALTLILLAILASSLEYIRSENHEYSIQTSQTIS